MGKFGLNIGQVSEAGYQCKSIKLILYFSESPSNKSRIYIMYFRIPQSVSFGYIVPHNARPLSRLKNKTRRGSVILFLFFLYIRIFYFELSKALLRLISEAFEECRCLHRPRAPIVCLSRLKGRVLNRNLSLNEFSTSASGIANFPRPLLEREANKL